MSVTSQGWCDKELLQRHLRLSEGSADRVEHWRSGFLLPVLKHGPGSLMYVRVCARKSRRRSEGNWLDFQVLRNRPIPTFGEGFEYEDIC